MFLLIFCSFRKTKARKHNNFNHAMAEKKKFTIGSYDDSLSSKQSKREIDTEGTPCESFSMMVKYRQDETEKRTSTGAQKREGVNYRFGFKLHDSYYYPYWGVKVTT